MHLNSCIYNLTIHHHEMEGEMMKSIRAEKIK